MLQFTCNICGTINSVASAGRETVPGPLCTSCRSSTRFRKIAFVLANLVFKGDDILTFNKNRLVGVGLSDAACYAKILSKISNYTNTFYHREPYLDIMRSSTNFSEIDYLISSDVFEHTPPPANIPFQNAYKMLKKGGEIFAERTHCAALQGTLPPTQQF